MGRGFSFKSFVEDADPRAIEDAYRAATRRVEPCGVLPGTSTTLVGTDGDDDDLLEANITVAAPGRVQQIVEAIEDEARHLGPLVAVGDQDRPQGSAR